jgi:hypothetical protein
MRPGKLRQAMVPYFDVPVYPGTRAAAMTPPAQPAARMRPRERFVLHGPVLPEGAPNRAQAGRPDGVERPDDRHPGHRRAQAGSRMGSPWGEGARTSDRSPGQARGPAGAQRSRRPGSSFLDGRRR